MSSRTPARPFTATEKRNAEATARLIEIHLLNRNWDMAEAAVRAHRHDTLERERTSLRDLSIGETDLALRAINALEGAGIITVQQLRHAEAETLSAVSLDAPSRRMVAKLISAANSSAAATIHNL